MMLGWKLAKSRKLDINCLRSDARKAIQTFQKSHFLTSTILRYLNHFLCGQCIFSPALGDTLVLIWAGVSEDSREDYCSLFDSAVSLNHVG